MVLLPLFLLLPDAVTECLTRADPLRLRRIDSLISASLLQRLRTSFWYYYRHFFLAVFAAFLKSLAVGAPLDPGLRIFSPDPALIRLRLAWMLAYSPRLAISVTLWLFYFTFLRHLLSPLLF